MLLFAHSYLRWLVLLLLSLNAIRSTRSWIQRRPRCSTDLRIDLATMISVDIQFLLGLALYLFLSPVTRIGGDLGWATVMRDATLRFWTIEHLSLMVLATFTVHLGRILARRTADERARHRRTAVASIVALLLILIAIPWPFRSAIGRPWIPVP